jgi:hypothetical protein
MSAHAVETPDAAREGRFCFGLSIFVAVISLAILLVTSRDYGMVWDEGHTIRRELILGSWLEWIVRPPARFTRADAFSETAFQKYWPFSREEPDGHPPFYAMIGLAGWSITHTFLEPLDAYRFGPMLLFAVTNGIVCWHLSRTQGVAAGITAASILLFMPRMFAHAHYAHYDMPMTCLWLLAQVAFMSCLRSSRWIVPFGVMLGLAAATKFTGWFAPVASIVWVVAYEALPWLRHWWKHTPLPAELSQLAGTRAVIYGVFAAVVVLYVIQPPWWFSPWEGIVRFLESNLTRADTKPISTLYLGTTYAFSLPWHNTIVLTAVAVPVFAQVLGVIGMIAIFARRRTDRGPVIWVLSWLVLMVVRALPTAPGHDGVRLFLPSIASLAVLAGIGAAWLIDVLRSGRLRWVAIGLPIVAVAECLLGIVQLYPYTLSYYNHAVGGLRGAERRGFELTYYWDTAGPEFLDWARSQAKEGPVELRFPSDLINMPFLREWGVLPRQVSVEGLENTQRPYYVLQRRRGLYYPIDSWLDENGTPVMVITRQGVDLFRVYSFEEAFRAFEETRHVPIPEYLPK